MLRRWSTLILATAVVCAAVGCKPKPKPPPPPAPAPAPPPPPPPAPVIKEITVSERIQFETDKAILLEQSKVVLGEVVRVLQDNPQIRLVEIGGHTDSTGDPGKNLLLSDQRARSVRDYLISQGIDGNRLRARGYGDRVPMGSNDTEEGKLQNRRVEFRIIEQGN